MIWLLKPDQPKATELAPGMDDSTGILPGLPSLKGKPVHVAIDGGRMTSDAGILLLAAIEQRLGIAERGRTSGSPALAKCIEDPRAPERVRHGLAEMIRYRALPIAAGYPRACPGAGRARHRDGHPDQDRPADRLPLPDRVHHARRPPRQAAAVSNGAVPQNKPLGATPNPGHPRPRRHPKPRPNAALTPPAPAPHE